MGLLDNLFKKRRKYLYYSRMLDGVVPIFGQHGGDVYASDVVQQALKCIVDEIKKLNPTHVRYKGNDPTPVSGTVQRVLDNPNPLMTTSEFLEKVTWLLLLNSNAFILPIFYTWQDETTGEERRRYEALYPLKPAAVEFIEDEENKLYVKFMFHNGYKTTIPYSDVIHIRLNYALNDIMGGDLNGQANNRELIRTLELNEKLLQGIAKAMNASYSISGIIKYNSLLDDGKMHTALRELENQLRTSTFGFLPLDLKAEFIPLQNKVQLVDSDTLKFIDEKILRNWGVPLSILKGDYTKAQYEAFYQKVLEPIVIQMSQALTKKIFTQREKSFGNKIELYPKELIFMSVAETLQMVNILAPTGAIFENEKRVAFGLRPLPELEGLRYMSLNWIDANNAAAYQLEGLNLNQEENNKGGDNGNT